MLVLSVVFVFLKGWGRGRRGSDRVRTWLTKCLLTLWHLGTVHNSTSNGQGPTILPGAGEAVMDKTLVDLREQLVTCKTETKFTLIASVVCATMESYPCTHAAIEARKRGTQLSIGDLGSGHLGRLLRGGDGENEIWKKNRY